MQNVKTANAKCKDNKCKAKISLHVSRNLIGIKHTELYAFECAMHCANTTNTPHNEFVGIKYDV